jgi:hypothetical protein
VNRLGIADRLALRGTRVSRLFAQEDQSPLRRCMVFVGRTSVKQENDLRFSAQFGNNSTRASEAEPGDVDNNKVVSSFSWPLSNLHLSRRQQHQTPPICPVPNSQILTLIRIRLGSTHITSRLFGRQTEKNKQDGERSLTQRPGQKPFPGHFLRDRTPLRNMR